MWTAASVFFSILVLLGIWVNHSSQSNLSELYWRPSMLEGSNYFLCCSLLDSIFQIPCAKKEMGLGSLACHGCILLYWKSGCLYLGTYLRRSLKFQLRLYTDHVINICSEDILKVRTSWELQGRFLSVIHRIVKMYLCVHLDFASRNKLNHIF